MKGLIQYLVEQIVDHPEAVEIKDQQDQYGRIVLSVKVAPQDIGQIIGKQGRIIKALREVVKILAVKHNKLVDIIVAETM